MPEPWTKEEAAKNVCKKEDGSGYIKLREQERRILQRGVYFRGGDIGTKHSIHGLFPMHDPEMANAAEQVLLLYEVWTAAQDRKMHSEPFVHIETVFPPLFGLDALLTHNQVPLYPNREQALEALRTKYPQQEGLVR